MLHPVMEEFVLNIDDSIVSSSAKSACLKNGLFMRAIVISSARFNNQDEVDTFLSCMKPIDVVNHLKNTDNQLDFIGGVFILKKSFI